MRIITAAILGIVEGLTEFLPISSTAHLTIASHLLGLAQTPFVKTFEIAIQSGAMLAVLFLYAKLLLKYRSLWISLIAGFIPTGIIGFAVYPFVKEMLIGNEWITVWALAVGGAGLIWFDYSQWVRLPNGSTTLTTSGAPELVLPLPEGELEGAGAVLPLKGGVRGGIPLPTSPARGGKMIEDSKGPDAAHVPIRSAVIIGLAQCLAFIPGVSRAAATIVSGLLLGLPRRTAIEFSFLLGLPTLAAATALDLYKNRALLAVAGNSTALAVGFVFAFLAAIIGIRFLLKLSSKKSLGQFGIYRILIAIAFAVVLMGGM